MKEGKEGKKKGRVLEKAQFWKVPYAHLFREWQIGLWLKYKTFLGIKIRKRERYSDIF